MDVGQRAGIPWTVFQASGGFRPLDADVVFLPSFHGIVRRQPRGPSGIIALECAPRASGRDDPFPVSHFLLYEFLLCSLFGVSVRLCFWPVTRLC